MMRVHTEDEKIVAILHDVLEDTPWTAEKLQQCGFPPHILQALDCVTKRHGERYEDFVTRSASAPIAIRANSTTSKTTWTSVASPRSPKKITPGHVLRTSGSNSIAREKPS